MGKIGTILVLILFAVFTGCGTEAPKPTKVPIPPGGQKPAAQAPAKEPAKATTEVAAVEPPAPVSFTYEPQGKRNPFQPLVVEKREVAPPPQRKAEQAAKPGGSGTPLENMDLAALKLVAIVWNIPNPRAMVEDGGGKGYILTVGTRIGKNQGEVKSISSAGVVVREKYEDDGKIKTREVPLRLYSE